MPLSHVQPAPLPKWLVDYGHTVTDALTPSRWPHLRSTLSTDEWSDLWTWLRVHVSRLLDEARARGRSCARRSGTVMPGAFELPADDEGWALLAQLLREALVVDAQLPPDVGGQVTYRELAAVLNGLYAPPLQFSEWTSKLAYHFLRQFGVDRDALYAPTRMSTATPTGGEEV